MALFDLSKEELERYRPETSEPGDFDAFWEATLSASRAASREADFAKHMSRLAGQDVYDVEFSGFNGDRVKAWLLLPRGRREGKKLPCVVEFVGYGGGRGYPHENLLYSSLGYAHFVMDTRGQGSVWRKGDTPDPEGEGACAHYPGFMTRGIESEKSYYYRRVMADAVMAAAAAASFPEVDADRIALAGGSQGGGLALAAAGLLGSHPGYGPSPKAALIDVPFLCHFSRAARVTDAHPYQEIAAYLRCHRDGIERAMRTLSYFDGMSFAPRANCPALFSVALMDQICPPSTVYAAYNRYAGKKDIKIYEFNGHEGGQALHELEKMEALAAAFA